MKQVSVFMPLACLLPTDKSGSLRSLHATDAMLDKRKGFFSRESVVNSLRYRPVGNPLKTDFDEEEKLIAPLPNASINERLRNQRTERDEMEKGR